MTGRRPFVPEALLVDFGGVLMSSTVKQGWREQVVDAVAYAVGSGVSREQIRHDLDAGLTAWRAWKAAMNRPYAPRDLSHVEFWCDFVGADWPGAARDAVRDRASELCWFLDRSRAAREPRTGTGGLLQAAYDADIPVAVVSNALCGQVHREELARLGMTKHIAVELYSDEAGIRKPNPHLIHQAAKRLDVPVGRAWYVGDRYDRDIVCGRRAGAGLVVLMRAGDTEASKANVAAAPDLIVDDPADLCRRLRDIQDEGERSG
ncbi:HAD family hydrolase [Nocardioidaceae bacterium SCSIO 66511]|nr:HAD family hydrolase [Nocardioidaceae bacterium SCSIO 66511]